MKKTTGLLLGIALFFAGVTCGFFLAPVKKGLYIGNNNGNKSGNNNGKLPGTPLEDLKNATKVIKIKTLKLRRNSAKQPQPEQP